MSNFLNQIKRHAAQMDSNRSHPQMGLVVAYNPADCTARVALQPENETTGWLPVKFPFVGPNIGLVCPPVVGQQVVVAFEGGERDSGVVLGGCYSNQSLPAVGYNGQPVQSGEIALVSGQSGMSFLHILQNGDIVLNSSTQITLTAPTVTMNASVNVNGTVVATGDIIAGDVSSHNHTHSGVQSGNSNTAPPNA